jgi:DNA-binding response OmpR family regulator
MAPIGMGSTTARGLGGVGQPADLMRPVSLDGVVVLAADTSAGAGRDTVRGLCADEHWSVVETATTDATAWAAAARKTSLVVVTDSRPAFVHDVVAAVRRSTTSPIAVLAALSSFDRKKVLGAGADLVLPESLDLDELRLHLTALLRRAGATWEPHVRYLVSDQLVIDLWGHTCELGNTPLHLPRTEYDLLVFLMRHPRRAITIEKIIQRVWQSQAYRGHVNAARIAVSRLRTKLDDAPSGRRFIRSVRGVGYEFIGPVLELGDGATASAGPELDNLQLSAVILQIASELRSLPFATAAQLCVDRLVATTRGVAGAIFYNAAGRIELIAERGHPEEFRSLLRGGVPLRGRSEVHAADLRQPTQVDDIARLSKTSESVRIMSACGFHSYLYIPLVVDGKVWGGLRLASRTTRPFDPVVTTFCAAVGAMVSMKLPVAFQDAGGQPGTRFSSRQVS